jgi:hypothetical protein
MDGSEARGTEAGCLVENMVSVGDSSGGGWEISMAWSIRWSWVSVKLAVKKKTKVKLGRVVIAEWRFHRSLSVAHLLMVVVRAIRHGQYYESPFTSCIVLLRISVRHIARCSNHRTPGDI